MHMHIVNLAVSQPLIEAYNYSASLRKNKMLLILSQPPLKDTIFFFMFCCL